MKIFPNETRFCGMSVKQAIQIADQHNDDPDWDFWIYLEDLKEVKRQQSIQEAE